MQIKTGGYYRRRDGQVVGPAENRNDPGTSYPWVVGGRFYTDDGAYDQFSPLHSYSLIAEVTVTDVLPFELKAGEKYETAKPDGSAGPVVELKLAKWTNKGMRQHLPFTFDCGYYCDVRGDAFNDFDPDSFLRITAPYIAPPPTIAERLEDVLSQLGAIPVALSQVSEASRLLNKAKAIAAELKESKP
jgi:hypothetical protein